MGFYVFFEFEFDVDFWFDVCSDVYLNFDVEFGFDVVFLVWVLTLVLNLMFVVRLFD